LLPLLVCKSLCNLLLPCIFWFAYRFDRISKIINRYNNIHTYRCRQEWYDLNREICIQAVGVIGKKTIPLDDAWFVEYNYGQYRWSDENNQGGYVNQGWYLMNKLQGIKQSITKEQAQTPEQISEGHSWTHIDDDQAKQLAVELGLAS
jgi:hypothetical protein